MSLALSQQAVVPKLAKPTPGEEMFHTQGESRRLQRSHPSPATRAQDQPSQDDATRVPSSASGPDTDSRGSAKDAAAASANNQDVRSRKASLVNVRSPSRCTGVPTLPSSSSEPLVLPPHATERSPRAAEKTANPGGVSLSSTRSPTSASSSKRASASLAFSKSEWLQGPAWAIGAAAAPRCAMPGDGPRRAFLEGEGKQWCVVTGGGRAEGKWTPSSKARTVGGVQVEGHARGLRAGQRRDVREEIGRGAWDECRREEDWSDKVSTGTCLIKKIGAIR